MSVQAWQVTSWSSVRTSLREWSGAIRMFRQLGTSMHVDDDDPTGLKHGQTIWGAELGGHVVGLAWDWREVRPNVIALSDPMAVLSNVVLIDKAGVRLTDSFRMIHLNTAIYRLGWQKQVTLHEDEWAESLPMAA